MSGPEDSGLLSIEVDAEDYAETAAADTPAVPRTYQSEADFRAVQEAYSARIDGVPGTSALEDLARALPVLASGQAQGDSSQGDRVEERAKPTKKEVQLLGYAVGELYFDRRYQEVLELCERVVARCDLDTKTKDSIERWSRRCKERSAEVASN